MANTPRLGTFLVTHHALALLGCFFLFARHRCASRSKTFEARPFRSPTIALSPRMPPYCRHGCKFMAVPRGFSNGFPGLTAMPPRPVGRLMRTATNESEERPGEAACAAETGRPLPLFSRPLKQTHGASPKGSTLPCTMQNATLGARGASPREVAHAERRCRMHGESKTHTPQRQRRRSWGGRHASCG